MSMLKWSLRGAAVVVAVCVVAGIAIGVQKYRSRVSAVSTGELNILRRENDSLTKLLGAADHKTQVIVDTLHTRFTVYDSLRKTFTIIDTSRFVVVDTQFVHSADSVRKSCSELTISCAEQRAAAARVIGNQKEQIEKLNIKLSHQPGKLQRIMDVLAGGGAGYLACRVTN